MTSEHTPNAHGVYPVQRKEILATHGSRSHALVELCHCDDGLHRYGLWLMYSYGGFAFPILGSGEGFPTDRAALDAGTQEMLQRFPNGSPHEPQSVHEELRAMKAQIEERIRQPSLF